jgi:hypothetical protein
MGSVVRESGLRMRQSGETYGGRKEYWRAQTMRSLSAVCSRQRGSRKAVLGQATRCVRRKKSETVDACVDVSETGAGAKSK